MTRDARSDSTRPVSKSLDRRKFLAATGGMVLAFQLPGQFWPALAQAANPGGSSAVISAWIEISADNWVTVKVCQAEMGQGVATSLPMLVAEEMEADWRLVRAEFATGNDAYKSTYLGREMLGATLEGEPSGLGARAWDWIANGLANLAGQQMTGGSSSIRNWYTPLREAGAAAREMLVTAAANRWNVSPTECTVENSIIHHEASSRQLGFGEVAAEAGKLTPPEKPALKSAEDFRLIGKPVPRLDLQPKVDGSAQFGIDVRLPDMLHAAVKTCPVFGGTLKSYDAAAITGMPGVEGVVEVPHGVAVVADSTWRAMQALKALPVTFDEGEFTALNNGTIAAQFRAAFGEEGVNDRDDGDAETALATAATRLSAEYAVPFLAHACMEPMNCTARVSENLCELWLGTQAPDTVARAAAETAGVDRNQVVVNMTYLGGGFGRRIADDEAVQAVTVAKAMGRPVKVTWSREEDIRHDYYRPAFVGRFEAGLDETGTPTAWTHKAVGPSIMKQFMPLLTIMGHDSAAVEGAANLPYGIPNLKVDYVMSDTTVPIGFWRSVGSSQNAFFTECFMDEVAHAAGRDPVEFRIALLGARPRFRAVLEMAAARAGWGEPLDEGVGRGIAIHESFGSIVAQVAEVEAGPDKTVNVRRVVCVIDCGNVVNPDTVKAQMEGGIIFGLSAALYGKINLENGRVVEGNFDTYAIARLAAAPEIETHIIESGALTGGVGEPGVPPIAPAVCNALFALTGERVRSLPIEPFRPY